MADRPPPITILLSRASSADQLEDREVATPGHMASLALWTVSTPLLFTSPSINSCFNPSSQDHLLHSQAHSASTSFMTSRQASRRDVTSSMPSVRRPSETRAPGLGACAGLTSCSVPNQNEVYGIQNRSDGRLVLGRPQTTRHQAATEQRTSSDAERYTMSYTIDHDVQARKVGKETMFDECVPCYNLEAERSLPGWVWSFFRSEAFLYTLHMTSIAVGAIKESMDLRENDPKLNLESSILETLATLALIIIRMANARRGYTIVLSSLLHLENVCPDNAHLKSMKFWLYIYLALGASLAVTCIVCFFIFYFTIHLGWTVLSNQFCLITIMVVSSLYVSRVTAAVVKIREDQHKVVILEATLLLGKICEFEQGSVYEETPLRTQNSVMEISTETNHVNVETRERRLERQRLIEEVKRFLIALNHTKLFVKPTHIDVRNRTTVIESN